MVTPLYKKNLSNAGIVCTDCSQPSFDHDFTGTYNTTSRKWEYETKCAEKYAWQGDSKFALDHWGNYNTFRMPNKSWIFAYSPCIKYMYLLPFIEAMALRGADTMLYPKPKIIRTVGDVYNLFLVRKEIDDLKTITKHSTFYRMKRTALVRIVQKT